MIQKPKQSLIKRIANLLNLKVVIALVCATIVFVVFPIAQRANAAIPKVINFQGKLTAVSNGTNVANGSYAFEFKLYTASSGGVAVWTETYDQGSGACNKLVLTNGVFNAKLGSCSSLSGIDFSGGAMYLTVNFAPTGTSYDGEMSPRKQLVASAYAFVANSVVGDGVVNNEIQSATALSTGRTSASPALQVDTNTASSVTGLKVTSAAAAGGLALAAISSGTNENLTLDAKGSGTLSLNGSATGDILLGGGSGSTGCTVTNSTGEFACTAGGSFSTLALTGAVTGATSYNGLVVTANTGVITTGTWQGTVVTVPYGGTGTNTFTTNGVLYGNSTSAVQATAQGGANTVLVANSGAPSFSSAITVGTSVTSPTINATTALQFGGADINTSGTLTNVAYENQANVFTLNQTITKADPALILNVTTATDTDFWLGVTDDAGGDDDDLFQIGDGTTPGTNPFFTLNTSGYVGIGTANPSEVLEVNGNIALSVGGARSISIVSPTGNTFGSNLSIKAQNGSDVSGPSDETGGDLLLDGGVGVNFGLDGDVLLATNSTGHVGIGDTSPASLLTVGNGDLFQVNSSGAIAAAVGITSAGGTVNLNNNSNFATNINTGTANTLVTIGGGSGTFSLQTTNIDISNAGAITGATGITSSGTITLSGLGGGGTQCVQTSNTGVLSAAACGGGALTPWTSDINAANFNLQNLGNLEFITTGGAPAGGVHSIYVNSNLYLNSVSGRNVNISIDGIDEFIFSETTLDLQSNTITNGAWEGNLVDSNYGGTGVNNGGYTITLGGNINTAGNFTTTGGHAITLSTSGSTNVTLPTTGTLATLAGTETLSGKTLTAPRIANGGFLADANGNEQINFTTTASAVNELTVTNAATTGIVSLAATGGDADVQLNINSKGADALNLNGTATGDILFGGGDISTGCTVTNSTGSFACSASGAFTNVILSSLGGGGTQCVQTSNTGLLSGTGSACGGGGSTAWSALTAPSGNLSLAHGANTTAFTFNSVTTANAFALSSSSLSSGSLLDLTVTGTAAASNAQKGLNIAVSGANATSTQTTYGAYITNFHTGTSSTNVGLFVDAGFGTENYAAIFTGRVGIGTTAPTQNLVVQDAGTARFAVRGGSGSTFMSFGADPTDGPFYMWNDSKPLRFATASSDSGTGFSEKVRIAANGNVGIGSTTTTSLFNVGSSAQFQVNSSGAIAAATGVTSTGTISLTSANTTQLTTASAFALNSNSLTSGTGLYAASSSLTSGKLIDIQVSGSGAASNSQTALNVSTSGANATSLQTTYGGYFSNTHTGTTSTNIGLYATASGGTNNYAAIFNGGNVGIGTSAPLDLLQVGSAINRGDLTVYGDITSKGLEDITALTDIKDVFVYDTTADSDGGRWIDWATTDQLSWYSESKDDGPGDACVISSDDRCGDSAFPRKAALVVTGSALYIFDANNNTLWMKFNQNASGYALGVDTNNDPSSVAAVNGVIYVGTNGSSAGGLYAIDFIQDRMYNYDATDRSSADVGIGSRNAAVTYNSGNDTTFDLGTVGTVADWARINDVSVAPITNSTTAINASTTSPRNGITLIGLATDSGLTVINLTDQKVNQYSDATDNDYNSVYITRQAKLYGLNETLGQAEKWVNIDNDFVSEVNGAPDKFWDETTAPPLTKTAPTVIAAAPDALEIVERGSLADGGLASSATVPGSSDLLYIGTNQGLTEIHDSNTSAAGWSKFFTTTRQTSLMTGNVRATFPMDEASGNVNDAVKTNILEPKGSPTYNVDGVRNKAISFNGSTDYLCADGTTDDTTCEVDADFNLSTLSWTVQTWFKHTSGTVTGVDTLFARCYTTAPAAATGCIAAAMNSSGAMVITVDDDALWTIGAATNNDITHTSTQAYNDNQWHHLAITKITGSAAVTTFIDGKQIGSTSATTTTLDGSQILGVGNDCSVGAACATGANFWTGAIDEFTWSANASGANDQIVQYQARRLFQDGRPSVSKRNISVTDATTATTTTIGDSAENWIPNEYAGQIVTLTGDTGSGQVRRVVSNTATVMTVSPPFTTTPDTTTDFKIDAEALAGATNSVTAVGVSAESLLGEARIMCVGTNDGSDGGAVTCYNHQAGPNIVADVYHADAKQTDDYGAEWTGTDYDDIRAVDMSGRTLFIGSMAHLWTETQSVQLGQGLDYLASKLNDIRMAVINSGLTALTGTAGLEVGFTGGADLAEHYYSTEVLVPGEIAVIDPVGDGDDILKSSKPYSNGILGVVSTEPGLILGTRTDTSYPIALTGRIPVKFSYENGSVKAGDYLTSSSIPGHAMRATGAGPIIGKALQDSPGEAEAVRCTGTVITEDESDERVRTKCATVMTFVEHGDFSGLPIMDLMRELNAELGSGDLTEIPDEDTVLVDSGDLEIRETKQDKILKFLKQMKDSQEDIGVSSQILTDRLSATFEVITPNLIADGLEVVSIGSTGRSIEVLSDLNLIGRPYFNNDTTGFATILAGDRYVDVLFEREYIEQPTIQATITVEEDERLADEDDEEIIAQINAIQDAGVEELFGSDIQSLVIHKSAHGFRIILNKPTTQDITFSWIALAVKQPRLIVSDGLGIVPPTVEIEMPPEIIVDEIEIEEDLIPEDTSSEEEVIPEGEPEPEAEPETEILTDENSVSDDPPVQENSIGLE